MVLFSFSKKEETMGSISAGLKLLLARTNLVVFPEDYVIVYLPIGAKAISGEWFRPATTRFAAVIQEPKLITMVVPRQKWLRMQNMFEKSDVNGPYKVITFDVKLSLAAIGYMATIGTILTESKISALPISSFKYDHIIVPKEELPRAVKVLRGFLEGCRKKNSARAKK
jgi:hypothetical protein